MPEAPVTDDALVEEIARVIRDALADGETFVGIVEHVWVGVMDLDGKLITDRLSAIVLAHLRERGMLVEVTTMPQPAPEEFARAVAEGEARGLAVAAAVRELRGKQPLPAAPTGETE